MRVETLDELSGHVAGWLFLLFVAAVAGMWAIDRGWIPFLRFQRVAGPREPPLWGASDVLLALAIWFLSPVALALVIVQVREDVSKGGAVFIVTTGSWAITCGFILLGVKRLLGQPLSTLGFAPTSCWNFVPVVGLYVLFLPVLSLIALGWNVSLLVLFDYEPQVQEVVAAFREVARQGDHASVALLAVTGAVVAPVGEELLFRGLLFGYLKERCGVLLAAVLSGLVFAAVHGSLSALVPLFALGCMLAYLYERTRSIYPSMAYHSLFNAVEFLVLLRSDGGSTP